MGQIDSAVCRGNVTKQSSCLTCQIDHLQLADCCARMWLQDLEGELEEDAAQHRPTYDTAVTSVGPGNAEPRPCEVGNVQVLQDHSPRRLGQGAQQC